MKFLVDENIALSTIKALRSHGEDVRDVRGSNLQGAKDVQLIAVARQEKRIILTHDKDFIGLFESQRLPFSVVVVRLPDIRSSLVERILVEFLDTVSQDSISERLIIIERFGARIITR